MTTDDGQGSSRFPASANIGRTWADVAVSAWGLLVITVIVGGLFIFVDWDTLPRIPVWVFVAVGMSLIFTPFLVARAKEDCTLLLVSEGPTQVSEWRVGRKFPLKVDGTALNLSSKSSGARRMLVTSFDPISGVAKGTALEGFTLFDIARDLTAFRRLGESFVAHLDEDRVHKEMVGVEVEKRVRLHSDQWLRMLYGSLSMSEVEDALGVVPETMPEVEPESNVEAVLDE